jgi:acyl-CoA hydrolase
MPQTLTPALFARYLRAARHVHAPGCAGHSPLLEQWLRAAPEAAAGVRFSGVWIPGVNRFDPTTLHADARATTFFLSPDLRAGWERGATDHLPLHYSEIVRWLATPEHYDLVLLHLAPPDAQGQCSLALAADFAPSALEGLASGAAVLAHLNPRLPRTAGPTVPMARITAWVEADMPPLTMPAEVPDDTLRAVAKQVAALVHDGDTLQFGLGKLQTAVLAQLHSHRGLRVHAGMVSDGLLGLRDADALAAPARGVPPVCTGVALGGPALYDAVADAGLVRFAPVAHTHAQATLAAIPNFTAINSALEIDLLGQVNCETLGGEQISGVGGLVDFMRGARASTGGRSIVAATATVGRHARSRVVPQLPPGPVGVARTDIDTVVTEHGAAHLRHLGVDARAQALIAVAAPAHREALQEAWHTLRRTL